MSYVQWTAIYCRQKSDNQDADCKDCSGEIESPIDYDGKNALQAQSSAASSAPSGYVLCRLRGEPRNSWYDDVLGIVGTGALIILIFV